MVAAILLAEGEAMSALGRPEADAGTSLAALREVLVHAADRAAARRCCSCCAPRSTA